MSAQSHHFLGFNQYFGELMHLAQGQNMVTPVGSNPGRLNPESDALPLCHRAPLRMKIIKMQFQ